MKATKGLEAKQFNKFSTGKIQKPFIAEITGLNNNYSFKKVYLKNKVDFAESNRTGSQGIYFWYLLEENKIYEVKERVSWKNFERYYIKIDSKGSIIKISKTEVYECLQKYISI